jgi:hypothetical protein
MIQIRRRRTARSRPSVFAYQAYCPFILWYGDGRFLQQWNGTPHGETASARCRMRRNAARWTGVASARPRAGDLVDPAVDPAIEGMAALAPRMTRGRSSTRVRQRADRDRCADCDQRDCAGFAIAAARRSPCRSAPRGADRAIKRAALAVKRDRLRTRVAPRSIAPLGPGSRVAHALLGSRSAPPIRRPA